MKISGGDKLEAKLAEIAKKVSKPGTLRVGFLENATYPDGTNVAFVAAMNNFGHGIGKTPGEGEEDTRKRVPPRPFFSNMVKDKSGEWPKAIGGLLKKNDYDATKVLEITGKAIGGQLQASIQELTSPPLAESTVARKGFAKPLIDTGHMLNSVDSEVKS